jgi:hypothetical protein
VSGSVLFSILRPGGGATTTTSGNPIGGWTRGALAALVFSLVPSLGVRSLAILLVVVLVTWAAAGAALRTVLIPPAPR